MTTTANEAKATSNLTDKEKLVALLTEFGVQFEDDTQHGKIVCTSGSTKVSGYNGFYTDFAFDENGKFIELGAWE
jgi:proteasome assembly chaperone (PAC2) family protein